MTNELDITQEEIGQWMNILEGNQTDHPTNPTIATEETPIPASTTIIIPAEATKSATLSSHPKTANPTSAPSSNPISSNTSNSTSDLNPYRSMRRQQQKTPYPQSHTRWVAPDEPHRAGKFVMRCFYQGCPWGFLYDWPTDEEQFRYLQLICVERVWGHCHSTHWGLIPITEHVISQFNRPTQAPQPQPRK